MEDISSNISPAQYGGLPGSSTILALLNLLHNWYQALEKPKTVIRVLFLDFSKAFDLINHNKLLEDMKTLGVRDALIPWIASYLKGRKQRTKLGNVTSNLENVNGVIQRIQNCQNCHIHLLVLQNKSTPCTHPHFGGKQAKQHKPPKCINVACKKSKLKQT